MLTNLVGGDPEEQARRSAFLQELQQKGWLEGRNLRIERRRLIKMLAFSSLGGLGAAGECMISYSWPFNLHRLVKGVPKQLMSGNRVDL